MDSTTLVPEIREVKEGVDFSAPSLYAVCQQVEDGRATWGKQYEVAALLVLPAKPAGMKSPLGASEWVTDQGERVARALAPVLETHAMREHL